MAAGLGFKTFTTGEVLTAADVNGYLMQGVLVFASAAARNAAITSPQEGQFAFTKDTNGLWYYDGAAWVASGATGDIEGVTAGVGISGGGTSGTVTVTNSMATTIDAKGDLVPGTGADTFARLAVGTDYGFLQALASETTGLFWNNAAWTSYTPTITAGSGTLTTASATGAWIRIGKVCIVQTNWVVTTNGTGAGFIQLTLPFTTSGTYIRTGQGREYETTGNMLQIEAPPSDTIIRYRTYANNYPAGSNYKGAGQIIYEVA